MSEKILTLRVDENLKNAFDLVAKAKDITASQMIRHYMRHEVDQYMKNNKQGELLKGRK